MRNTSPFTLLLLSALITVAGLVVAAKFFGGTSGQYVAGTTTEYHPPATQDRAAAAAALDDAGFGAAAEDPAADIFIPTFEQGESIAIGTRLSHGIIDADELNDVHAAISILGANDGVQDRAPLNIALVIDRSGSMIGANMDYAKAASHTLIDALGPRDRLAIVTYSTEVSTLSPPVPVTDSTRAQLHDAIAAIECVGGTNISAGIEAARDLLVGVRDTESIDRIVMLSDGRANHGIQDADGIGRIAADSLEQGVSVTAMGVGLDYDERLMQAMATAGAGNYYFIEDGSMTETVFNDEISRLKSALARNTRLFLKPQPGVEISTVHGFPFQRTSNGVVIPLDAFTARERKDLLVELHVSKDQDGTRALFDTELRYTDVGTNKAVRKTSRAHVLAVAGEARLNVEVQRRVQQIRTLDAFETAMNLYDRGDRFAAADLLEKQQRDNRTFLDDADIEDAAFERVDKKLADLAESLRKTDRHSTKGKWIAKSTYSYANEAVSNQVVF